MVNYLWNFDKLPSTIYAQWERKVYNHVLSNEKLLSHSWSIFYILPFIIRTTFQVKLFQNKTVRAFVGTPLRFSLSYRTFPRKITGLQKICMFNSNWAKLRGKLMQWWTGSPPLQLIWPGSSELFSL